MTPPKTKIKVSPEPAPSTVKDIESKNEDESKVVIKSTDLPDSLKGVPEMWFEPATEPIEGSELITKSEPNTKSDPAKPKKETPAPMPETKKVFHNIVILDSKICKKVKNNQPMGPGRRFPTDIGRVYCHSLLNNNSGKHNDIYHIWYINGEMKAKVRIRVRDGQEIPAVSHREVVESDKGTWKVEITDSDKKILDTIIFELV